MINGRLELRSDSQNSEEELQQAMGKCCMKQCDS